MRLFAVEASPIRQRMGSTLSRVTLCDAHVLTLLLLHASLIFYWAINILRKHLYEQDNILICKYIRIFNVLDEFILTFALFLKT